MLPDENTRDTAKVLDLLSTPSPSMDALRRDIQMAATSSAPVLISAPPLRAWAIARAIARASDPDGVGGLLVYDAVVDADLAAIGEDSASVDRHVRSLLIWEVHKLSPAGRAALAKLLAGDGAPWSRPRVMASSSISLYESTTAGEFDARLFYRLNTIHIVP